MRAVCNSRLSGLATAVCGVVAACTAQFSGPSGAKSNDISVARLDAGAQAATVVMTVDPSGDAARRDTATEPEASQDSASPADSEQSVDAAPVADVLIAPNVLNKPTVCEVDKDTNLVKGIGLDQLPPNFAYTAPIRPAAKPSIWANNGVWFEQQPSLLEGHVIQAYKGHVYVADRDGAKVLDFSDDLQLLRSVPAGDVLQISVSVGGGVYVLHVAFSTSKLGLLGPQSAEITELMTLPGDVSCFLMWKDKYIIVGDAQTGAITAVGIPDGTQVWQAQTYGIPRSIASDGSHIIVGMQTGEPRMFALPKTWTPEGEAWPKIVPTATAPLRGQNPWHTYDTQTGNIHPQWQSSHGFAATSDGARVLVAHSLAVTGSEEIVALAKEMGVDPSMVIAAKKVPYYGFSLADPCNTVPVRPLEMAVTAFENGVAVPSAANLVTRDPQTDRNWLAQFDQPIDLRVHPTRTLAFVAARGTDNVLVLNTRGADPMQIPIAVLQAGQGPVGVAVADGMPFAYTLDIDSRTVTRIPLAQLLAVIDTGTQVTTMTEPLHIAADKTVELVQSYQDINWMAGRRIFHAANNPNLAAGGRQACASCHIAGRDDKLVWATKTGMRQTVSLAGRIAGTAPYGWTGEFADLDAKLVQSVQHMGGSGLSGPDQTQLANYVLSLKLPQAQFKDAPYWLSQQGFLIFHDPDVGCASCHAGPKYTDGKAYDVGTATSADTANNGWKTPLFDTPSLLGVGSNAPYLHDGSAATLWDVVDHTLDKMGKTGKLNASQKDALVAYLQGQ